MTFEELYEEYSNDVYRFSYWLSGNRMEAEDITSETFIRAWVKFSKIRTETLKGYLFTVARNIFIDEVRKNKKYRELRDVHTDKTPEPGNQLESKQELERVQKMLMTFSEIDRAAFILRVEQELSYEEISRILEISLVSAKVKVHRVRKKLIENRLKMER